jgi:hypothetical protein
VRRSLRLAAEAAGRLNFAAVWLPPSGGSAEPLAEAAVDV